ncbi:branched-chain amino acid ABC transporter permease [Antarcticirhabdus aurantiaca]|uniref:Branched-chain amino acid ABC transporter permease n=1 Tax=Antarcticirhabdus aurantiaca TaxID=2606717 RepID=A0ACD4NI02_9HYPH|nr:branched-chain amino acid ABC transporter permease [Antarcticirhabdus aurantiaca]WAJ26371.1 branched-chain amino acid ABC transporter permease [Jeongeuplla avenae]
MSMELFGNALLSGLLLGGFYAAVAVGITIAFGMLDIVNIAHPAFIMLGAFVAYWLNVEYGLDPLLAALVAAPFAYIAGRGLYRYYHGVFERRSEDSLQGLAFFFGLLFVVEVSLLLVFGVDYRFVSAPYIGPSLTFGDYSVPYRMLVPFLAGLGVVALIALYLGRTFTGRAILAVSQDPGALRLVGGNPVKIKEAAFGLSIATAMLAGALLVIIQPIEPSMGREFIGRAFAICVLGGMTSLLGTVVAGAILGVAEAMTTTYVGAAWGPAVSFGLLLITLAVRPSGIFGR